MSARSGHSILLHTWPRIRRWPLFLSHVKRTSPTSATMITTTTKHNSNQPLSLIVNSKTIIILYCIVLYFVFVKNQKLTVTCNIVMINCYYITSIIIMTLCRNNIDHRLFCILLLWRFRVYIIILMQTYDICRYVIIRYCLVLWKITVLYYVSITYYWI